MATELLGAADGLQSADAQSLFVCLDKGGSHGWPEAG